MRLLSRFYSKVWVAALLGAAGFLVWVNHVRIQRVEYVTGIGQETVAVDPASPTGYAGGLRQLIIPERNNDSYHWIAQTQQMFAQHQWRVRHVAYDNAPFGREVLFASPYRWWLGAVAWLDHQWSGCSLGLAVERAAVWANPLLHLLLLIGATCLTARYFGNVAATLIAIGVVTLFPFAAGFLPGVPDHHALAQVGALVSVLLLVVGLRPRIAAAPAAQSASPIEIARAAAHARRWFFIAGMAGAFGLWVSVSGQSPILFGVGAGALLAAWITRGRSDRPSSAPPWRAWSLGGALAVLAACLIEYFPSHLGSWRLDALHPLHGLAWLGGGELLARATDAIQSRKLSLARRDIVIVLFALIAAVSPAVPGWMGQSVFSTVDPMAARLTNLPDGGVAENFGRYLAQGGHAATALAMCLPLLMVGATGWLVLLGRTDTKWRAALAIALGPVFVTLGLAFGSLQTWNLFDGAWLVSIVILAAAVAEAARGSARWAWCGLAAIVFVPGVFQLIPARNADGTNVLTVLEVEGLIERNIAHWLAKRSAPDRAVLLAPPAVSTTVSFYGGASGLASFSSGNRDGLAAASRVVSAGSPDEAAALLQQRGVTHILIPSWDAFLDEFARRGASQPENSFIAALHRWAQPPWLRPIPYQLPGIAGFEGQRCVVFEVVEEQSQAVMLSRQAEYFVEMGQLDFAAEVGVALARFPADLGALVARAHVAAARNDTVAHHEIFSALLPFVTAGADRRLPWDRRLSLAFALAQARRLDLARAQIERCLAELNEKRLRALTPTSLFRLLLLTKASAAEIADPQLRALARDLVPPPLQSRL